MVKCQRCNVDLGPAEKVCPICNTPRGERPVEEFERRVEAEPGVLGDGITLKDYYDLRDLRLLLWNLEKELAGKYGIMEAIPVAAKLRGVIEDKVKEIGAKISPSSHHSNPGNPSSLVSSNLCQLLDEVAGALYLVYEQGDPNVFDRGRYEELFTRIEELKEKLR